MINLLGRIESIKMTVPKKEDYKYKLGILISFQNRLKQITENKIFIEKIERENMIMSNIISQDLEELLVYELDDTFRTNLQALKRMASEELKVNLAKLVEENEALKGTENYSRYHMELHSKINGKWAFIGWNIPSYKGPITHTVKGVKENLYLIENNDGELTRYILNEATIEKLSVSKAPERRNKTSRMSSSVRFTPIY